ncbi:cobaltochelatase subunit CobN [Steroidobacter sp.]|uniref:cobaltochelatase subunit CobN n=1 Tax=Steroidobacter sp. TaxID=1978227 RepID=UPI001A46A3BF|nr:cobaltochelatase subunit CobN [Steroidobacter sp.]MBL8270431.1 cobaltochelatase subunit CobN [Steroidobacter sp.]
MFLLLSVVAYWSMPVASAATLVAVVSERNSGDLAQAARDFNQRLPEHRLIFRTTSQIDALSDAQLQELIVGADALLLATVFKETAQRIQPLLATSRAREIIAVAGDPALGRQSRWRAKRLFAQEDPRYAELSSLTAEKDASAEAVAAAIKHYPQLTPWIQARAYWQNRGESNLVSLLALLLSEQDRAAKAAVKQIEDALPVRFHYRGEWSSAGELRLKGDGRVVAVLEDQHADVGVSEAICRALIAHKLECLTVLAGWGKPSSDALTVVGEKAGARLGAIVSVQDFIIGGSSDRATATKRIEQLDVPVLKALRLHDVTAQGWRSSEQGLAWDSVYYRVAMPELQGISQPVVVAAAAAAQLDALTGIEVTRVAAIPTQVEQLTARIDRWLRLQQTKNADKRVAIVYYNHPPGRHNIGADNLDVPASLLEILRAMKRDGYDTGPLPETSSALLEKLQHDGVNLPEQGDVLRSMATRVTNVSADQYGKWFATLPMPLQKEMTGGPLAFLQANVLAAQAARLPQEARGQVTRTLHEIEHLLEGAQHPSRDRAIDLVKQLQQAYEIQLTKGGNEVSLDSLTRAISATGIEGLRGWGEIPGNVMVNKGKLVLPGVRFGKIFVGPQPPRGWELNEELLHANTSIPPTHQYLAFYFWLRNEFGADAIVHLGRHSTYEFLPRKGVGQDELDYPALIAGDVPGIYPYIVDGVGEGLQAKRRGLAVMIDHLIPPLTATPLYDDLLRLRQLVESYESSNNPALRKQAAASMRVLIDELHLKDALTASMDAELKVRGISFEQADDELLVHEIGHYLTHLQEDFMPLGLHIFGKPWSDEALNTMLVSMKAGANDQVLRQNLQSSPANEMRALLHGLSGRFIPAGPGNDPIRNAEALPTGRNFHGLDNSLIPSRLGYTLGEKLATEARAKVKEDGKEAVILWASDSVRDEGAMVGFGLSLLGVKPDWNSRGIVAGLERQPLNQVGLRADTVFVASGLFRDLFGQQIAWLDKAVLLALDGSRRTIERSRPDLAPALRAALEPLGTLANPGDEPLARNHVARHWVNETSALIKQGLGHAEAGKQASLRVFGTSPGDYSAGINRAVERSGSWNDRKELAKIYIDRLGHAYSANGTSQAQQALLRSNLREVRNTYLGRSSNLYGLMDNNDAFDYLGGLSLAVETLSGRVPASHVADHSNPAQPQMQPLPTALLTELRGRYLNPAWIKPLMQHGYAGARTMGSEFMEYLWGWQVTNPDVIKTWAWDEVKQVYVDDSYGLGLDEFLEQGSNVHVKTNMMAILLVAAEKQFWQTDEATLQQLSQQWVDLLLQHGLPGSGHTQPDHPVFQWVQPYLRADQIEPLKQMLERARVDAKAASSPTTLTELQPADKDSQQSVEAQAASSGGGSPWVLLTLMAGVAVLLSAGYFRGRHVAPKGRSV